MRCFWGIVSEPASNQCKSTKVHVTQNPSFQPPCQLQLNFRCDPVQRNPHPQQAFGLSPQRAGLAATLLELLPGSGTEPLVPRPTSLVSSRLLSASNKCKSTTVHVTQNPSFQLLVNFIELSLDLVHAILTHNKHSAYHQWVGLATTLLELLPGSGAEPLVPRPTSLVAVVERLTGAQNCAVEGER